MKNLKVILLLILIFGLLFQSCKDKSKEVTAAYVPSGYYLPFLVVEHDQLLAKRGYSIKLTSFPNNSDMINSFINGNLDVTAQSAITMFPIEEKHPGNFKFIYAQDNLGYSFVVRKNGNISRLDDLKGKKIGTWTSPTAVNCIKIILREKNIKDDDYEIVRFGASAVADQLRNHNVDAVFLFDVAAHSLVVNGECVYLSKSAMKNIDRKFDYNGQVLDSIPIFNGGGFINPRLISLDPKKANAIKDAFIEAVNIINTEKERTCSILADYLHMNDSVAQTAVFDKFHITDESTIISAVKTQEILIKNRFMNDKVEVRSLFWNN